ncbi:MAG: AAA family ATPase [Oscillospiraceae bacterium]|jgi:cytidylate kinase
MNRIICISREYGSGGHEIAEKAAGMLEIPCLDKQLMEQAISLSGLPQELLKEAEEKLTNPFLYMSVYHGNRREFYGMSPGDIVFELEKRHIIKQANNGDCIIVGRCAEEVLKDLGHLVVNVFITAPLSYRVQRIQREFPNMI